MWLRLHGCVVKRGDAETRMDTREMRGLDQPY
jgi:hypothetical protein